MQLPLEWKSEFFIKVREYIVSNYQGLMYIDIGAHVGHSIFFFTNSIDGVFTKIIGIEPDSNNFDLLQKNINNAKLHNVGIFYGVKESKVYGNGDNSPAGYFVESIGHKIISHTKLVPYNEKTFKLKPLEEIIEIENRSIFIKIDVEGSEYNILENSTIVQNAELLLLEFHHLPGNEIGEYVSKFVNTYNYNIISSFEEKHYFLRKHK